MQTGAGAHGGGAAGSESTMPSDGGVASAGVSGAANDASGGDAEISTGGSYATTPGAAGAGEGGASGGASAGSGATDGGAAGATDGGAGGAADGGAAGAAGANSGCGEGCPANTECLDDVCRALPTDLFTVAAGCSITEMQVHADVVYFTDAGPWEVHATKFDGTEVFGGPLGDSPGAGGPSLSMNAQGVYWIDKNVGYEQSDIDFLPFTGLEGFKTVLNSDAPQGMVLRDRVLYHEDSNELFSFNLDDSSSRLRGHTDQRTPWLAVDADATLFDLTEKPYNLERRTIAGPPQTLVDIASEPAPAWLRLAGATLLWAHGSTVFSLPANAAPGTAPTRAATTRSGNVTNLIATDAGLAFFTEAGLISTVTPKGVQTVARDDGTPSALATDGTRLFWASKSATKPATCRFRMMDH